MFLVADEVEARADHQETCLKWLETLVQSAKDHLRDVCQIKEVS